MGQKDTQFFASTDDCIDAILAKVGKHVVFGMPLGLGKPYRLVNALYHRARLDRSITLKIVTAISLEIPEGKSQLEKNFLGPFIKRQFKGVPELAYIKDVRSGQLPDNVEVCEFFFKAGSFINSPSQQQNFVYSNYTHAARDIVINGVNVLAQMVAKQEINGKTRYSFSCNPDLSIDLLDVFQELENQGIPVAMVGEVNSRLPFMHNHAIFEASDVDMIIDQPRQSYELFGVPNGAITPADHMIGYLASLLVQDGGTLQVGIGSLGSGLVCSTLMRHQHNASYRQLVDELNLSDKHPIINKIGGKEEFIKGLYGCSEMMVDGFLHLYHAGILTREVFDDYEIQLLLNSGKLSTRVSLATLDVLADAGVINQRLRSVDIKYLKRLGVLNNSVEFKGGSLLIDGEHVTTNLRDQAVRSLLKERGLGHQLSGGVVMHGGFYLGPGSFYQMLRELTDEQHQKFCMTSVNFINHLYDHQFGRQDIKVAQRKQARFINSTMMATMAGAAVSDGLANGKIVSGVGGQYNFVAMAHEMNDARSILKFKSTRLSAGKVVSNILYEYGHTTIPAHLRDIFVTEYGIADVLGRPEKDVYIEMLKITDSRFQDELLAKAKKNGKIPSDYQLPDIFRHNHPQRINAVIAKYQRSGFFDPFPFGNDFTNEEVRLGKALKALKANTSSKSGALITLMRALTVRDIPREIHPLLERIKLDAPVTVKQKILQKMLVAELIS